MEIAPTFVIDLFETKCELFYKTLNTNFFMRINPKEKLFDQPVLKVREILRQAMAERLFGRTKIILIKQVSNILQQPTPIARKVIEQLIQNEYIIIKKIKYVDVYQYEISETEKGRRFGIASADPAIPRQKADQLLNELITKAREINLNDELLYLVERIKVFGSYLSSKNMLGDVDVAVKLKRKKEGAEFDKASIKRIEIALENGRRFSNVINQIYWPHTEVMMLLKTRKKGLSLHDEDRDAIVNKTRTQIVYEFKESK